MSPVSRDLFAVVGATGNVGKIVAERLLAAGQGVRAIGRDAGRLAALAARGAEAFVGSAEDAAAMTRAFAGARGAFLMIPPAYATPEARAYQSAVGAALAGAVAGAGVRRVVVLSSVAAHLPDRTGPIKGLYDFEQRLNALAGVDILHLRPAFFMENHLYAIGVIRQMGIYGSPMRADLALPMIATRDIGAAAAAALLEGSMRRVSAQELLGPRDYTMAEAAAILGRAIGRPDLAYAQFPYADAERALLGMGMSPDWARTMIEMYRGFNDGIVVPAEARSARNTTPTTLEEFAKLFAAAFAAS